MLVIGTNGNAPAEEEARRQQEMQADIPESSEED